jgi:hypothetical protein
MLLKIKKLIVLFLVFTGIVHVKAQVIPTPLDLSLENGIPLFISPVSVDTLWAGVTGINDFTWVNLKTYAKSTNGGITWTKDTIPDPVDRGIIDFFAINSSHAWAVMGDFNLINLSSLYATADGGINWTPQ